MTKFVWAENWQDLCGRCDDYFQPETGENNMDNTTTTSQSFIYGNYCANRLPCGVCRLLNAQCPMAWGSPNITWTCQTQTGSSTQATINMDEMRKTQAWNKAETE